MRVLLFLLLVIFNKYLLISQNELKYSNNEIFTSFNKGEEIDNTKNNFNSTLSQKNSINIHKVDEKGNYRGKSLPSQNLSETPYKREEETKPVNNSKANTPK